MYGLTVGIGMSAIVGFKGRHEEVATDRTCKGMVGRGQQLDFKRVAAMSETKIHKPVGACDCCRHGGRSYGHTTDRGSCRKMLCLYMMI